MAIYDAGTASLAADGTVIGVGTTWRQPLTLIRVGATMIFNTTPASIVTIAEIISDTEIRVFNDKGFTAPDGTQYSILAHDGITVQGLAQDVAETLRYYQSRETEIASAVDAFNQFDADAFQQNVTTVNNQSQQVANDAAQVSSDKAVVSADKDSAAASAASAMADRDAAAASAAAAADSAASLDTSNLLRVDMSLSDLTNKTLSRTNLDVYSKGEVDAKTNRIKVFATDFGFGGTREQNEQALYDIYLYLKDSSIPVDLKFPSGIYEIGSQTQSGTMGAGYAFRPSYLDRVWDDESAAGWFSISNTEMDHVIDMSGCTLKMAPGMKVGSFDPVTGQPFNQGSMETPLFDYNSNTGVMIKVRLAPNIKIINGITDGNLSEAVFGGKFGNTGYQTLCYNAWFNESLGVQVSGHRFINSPVDGCYFQHPSEFLDTNIVSESRFYDCHFTNCGRNCFSLTGGRNVKFSGCVFSNSGRMASSIGENYSGPETCCDIEAESGVLDTISFEDCYLINAGKHSVYTVSVPYSVRNVKFTNSIINSYHSEGAISNVGPTRDVSFIGCRIVGSIIDSGYQFIKNAYTIDSCSLSNNYAGNFVDSYLLSFKVRLFKHNKIEFSIPPSGAVVSSATINISDQDMVTYGVSSSRFYGNEIEVYGDASRVTFANGLGGISNFKSMELHVNSAGVTNGNLKMIVDSSSVSLNGLTCNSSNFSFSPYTMIKDDSQDIWFANAKTRVNSIVAASATNQVDIGSKTQLFSTAYMQKGIVFQDLVNTGNYYRVRIVNGAIDIVKDV